MFSQINRAVRFAYEQKFKQSLYVAHVLQKKRKRKTCNV